jgi:hypothetical protein
MIVEYKHSLRFWRVLNKADQAYRRLTWARATELERREARIDFDRAILELNYACD